MSIARLHFVDQHFCLKVLVCLCTKSCNLGTCHLKQSSDKKTKQNIYFCVHLGQEGIQIILLHLLRFSWYVPHDSNLLIAYFMSEIKLALNKDAH